MKPQHAAPLALLLSLAVLLPGCAAPEPEPTLLTIGTADRGGAMTPAGSAIAALLSDGEARKVSVSVSSGSAMNVHSLAAGDIDLGLVSGDVAYAAYAGTEEFEGQPQPLRAVAAVYSSVSCWIAPADSPAAYVHDLGGLRLGVGPQDSTTELSARTAVELLGLDTRKAQLVNCSLEDGARQIAGGSLDALHAFAGVPARSLTWLTQQESCRLLPFTDEELSRILAENQSYYAVCVPAGTYSGQTEDLNTFGAKCLLCVRADAPDELVYQLTQTLYHGAEELAQSTPALAEMARPEFLYEDLPIPLHQGAADFYRAEGLIES